MTKTEREKEGLIKTENEEIEKGRMMKNRERKRKNDKRKIERMIKERLKGT